VETAPERKEIIFPFWSMKNVLNLGHIKTVIIISATFGTMLTANSNHFFRPFISSAYTQEIAQEPLEILPLLWYWE
jgi:hypothetical protein